MYFLSETNQKNMFQAFAFAALTAALVLHSFTTDISQMVINSFTVKRQNNQPKIKKIILTQKKEYAKNKQEKSKWSK